MNILQKFKSLLAEAKSHAGGEEQTQASAVAVPSLFDKDTQAAQESLGVKYVSRFAWQILPPAGWRRHDYETTGAWPVSNVSPSVTFELNQPKAGQRALIRWQLLCRPETPDSHRLLHRLLESRTIKIEDMAQLEAPGMVQGNQIQSVENLTLAAGHQSILVVTRLAQCKGEEAVLRYVLILPDREVKIAGSRSYYRESLQYAATETIFGGYETLAIASMKTFRRTHDGYASTDFVSAATSFQTVN